MGAVISRRHYQLNLAYDLLIQSLLEYVERHNERLRVVRRLINQCTPPIVVGVEEADADAELLQLKKLMVQKAERYYANNKLHVDTMR